MKNKSKEWLEVNIYKAGTKKYYRDSLSTISALAMNYDGFNTVKGLKSLIDDIRETANDTLKLKKLYFELK